MRWKKHATCRIRLMEEAIRGMLGTYFIGNISEDSNSMSKSWNWIKLFATKSISSIRISTWSCHQESYADDIIETSRGRNESEKIEQIITPLVSVVSMCDLNWKNSFGKMSGGLGKNSEPLPRSWNLEEFRAPL